MVDWVRCWSVGTFGANGVGSFERQSAVDAVFLFVCEGGWQCGVLSVSVCEGCKGYVCVCVCVCVCVHVYVCVGVGVCVCVCVWVGFFFKRCLCINVRLSFFAPCELLSLVYSLLFFVPFFLPSSFSSPCIHSLLQ